MTTTTESPSKTPASRKNALVPLKLRRAVAKLWFRRAARARDSARWRSAAACYRRGLGWDETRPGPWIQLGHALKEAERYEDAIDAYKTAVVLNPDWAEPHFQLGDARERAGDALGALWSFQRALALDPGHAPSAAAIQRVRSLAATTSANTPSAAYEFPFEEQDLVWV